MSRRVLCLHGYVQNGPVFARKSSGIRKAMKKNGFELVYLTAPVKISIADLPFDVPADKFQGEESDMRSWWPNSESDPDYLNPRLSYPEIKESIEKDGPFEGVIGFSQGAGLAAFLCQAITEISPSQPPLKFAIFFAGFKLKRPDVQSYYETKIKTPTLHYIGTLDTVVEEERTMALYNNCEEATRTLILHPGGHYVPNGKDLVNKAVAWVKEVTEEKKPEESKEEKTNWDEFDNIGKA